MKKIFQNAFITMLLVCLLIAVPVFGQSGGDYDLSWNTIDGGGGTSSGGSYVVKSTIGQPDAGVMSGGDYEMLSGFWPGEPLCVVDFRHFARFAEWWLYIGDCSADLYDDDIVDYLDLGVFVDEWLDYCPGDWPLK